MKRGFLGVIAVVQGALASVAAHSDNNSSACRLLTEAQVSAAVGVNVDHGAAVPAVRDACVWRESGKPPGETPPLLEIQILTAQDYDRIKTFRAAASISESGLGDEAHFFRDAITGGFQLMVKFGTRFFAVVSWPPHPGTQQSESDDERSKAIERAIARILMGKTA
jgi:hypothetical protein